MNREDYYKRLHDFDGPIRDTALNSPIVNSIINMYVQGNIVTKEEALSQMVVQLVKANDLIMKAATTLALNSFSPLPIGGFECILNER